MLKRCLVTVATAAALIAGCSSAPEDATASADQTEALSRDFASKPAILEIEAADHVYAVSDVHGQYEIFVRLLAGQPPHRQGRGGRTKVKWTGGTATLVIAGDHIDKGPKSIDVIDLLRSLEEQAPRSGGRVVALMGNHEAEFLDDPRNSKASSTGTDALASTLSSKRSASTPARWRPAPTRRAAASGSPTFRSASA